MSKKFNFFRHFFENIGYIRYYMDMIKNFYKLHAYGIQIILNLIPCFIVNIFYDNQTYIGNQLHHPLYLFLWTVSTVFGLYTYSKKIWEKYAIDYHAILHLVLCIGMIFSSSIPYAYFTILKDLHVWLSIFFVAGFLVEWFYYMPIHLNKNSIQFFSNIGLSLLFTFMFGHITGFCEIYFSLTTNMLLLHWLYSN